MILLTEEINDIEYLTEGTGANKAYYITGPFIQPGVKNGNGRIYPEHVMDREVESYTKKYINENRAFGELGHPDGPKINLDRVSHIIKSLKKEGRDYYGKAKIMDTPYGKIVKNFLDEGAKIGVSTRGVGTVTKKNGIAYINEDYRLSTAADIVGDPSAPDAFVQGLRESKEWMLIDGVYEEVDAEKAKKMLLEAHSSQLNEVKITLLEGFFNKLAKGKK
jgi:hypothetical protein